MSMEEPAMSKLHKTFAAVIAAALSLSTYCCAYAAEASLTESAASDSYGMAAKRISFQHQFPLGESLARFAPQGGKDPVGVAVQELGGEKPRFLAEAKCQTVDEGRLGKEKMKIRLSPT